jgi:hypothetical protein
MPPPIQSKTTVQSTDFCLPGIDALGTSASRKTELAYAVTLSYKSNIRNLENYSYAFWGMVFAHLTFDLPKMIVIPQYVLHHKRWSTETPPPSSDPNETIDSIRTEPDATAQSVIPDFVVARVRVNWLSKGRGATYRDAEIKGYGLPILIEVKRFCSRSLVENTNVFLIGLYNKLQEAHTDLMTQAKHLFRAHSKQDSVILIACAGNWWDYRVVDRSSLTSLDDDEYVPGLGEDREDDSAGDEVPEGVDATLDYSDDESEDPLDIIDLLEGGAGSEEAPLTSKPGEFEVAELIPENQLDDIRTGPSWWSGMMKINTSVSNQRMSVIHGILHTMTPSRSYSRG